MAAKVGIEPTTKALTVLGSTTELLRIKCSRLLTLQLETITPSGGRFRNSHRQWAKFWNTSNINSRFAINTEVLKWSHLSESNWLPQNYKFCALPEWAKEALRKPDHLPTYNGSIQFFTEANDRHLCCLISCTLKMRPGIFIVRPGLYTLNGGGSRIWTHGRFHVNWFQVSRLKPLSHSS